MSKKIFFFLVIIGLGIFVWFYNTQNAKVESSFDKALTIMQGLQSRAIPISLTEDQVATLESAYQDSLARITSIRDFRDSDKRQLIQQLSSAGLSGSGENGLNERGENFIKLSLGKPDDFKDAISEEIQNLGLGDNTAIKDAITKKAESINTLSNDIRITSLYITWYEQLRPTLCTTNDANNDPLVAGKLNLIYKNETLNDTCSNGVLKQYKCINGVYKTEPSYETSVVCQNGCGNGVCLTENKSGFEITAPASTKVGEPITLRIKALGVNGEANTSYDKNFFVVIAGDDDAEFPTGPQRIRNGESTTTISNIKFSKAGTMQIRIRGEDDIEAMRNIIVNETDFVCPQLSPPPADFCKDGTVVDGGKNAQGCQLPPTCTENLSGATTGGGNSIVGEYTQSVNEGLTDCWFGDTTKTLSLSGLMSYIETPLQFLDEIILYGVTPPTIGDTPTNILSFESPDWTSANNGSVTGDTQLSNFFIFRASSNISRIWDIPSNDIKFYGCYRRGDRPTNW